MDALNASLGERAATIEAALQRSIGTMADAVRPGAGAARRS
jgi:hypothetical protein